eukprot:gene17398-biopygen13670
MMEGGVMGRGQEAAAGGSRAVAWGGLGSRRGSLGRPGGVLEGRKGPRGDVEVFPRRCGRPLKEFTRNRDFLTLGCRNGPNYANDERDAHTDGDGTRDPDTAPGRRNPLPSRLPPPRYQLRADVFRDERERAERQRPPSERPQVPDDDHPNASRYADLVVLASTQGLRAADLHDAASAREALRRHRDPPPVPAENDDELAQHAESESLARVVRDGQGRETPSTQQHQALVPALSAGSLRRRSSSEGVGGSLDGELVRFLSRFHFVDPWFDLLRDAGICTSADLARLVAVNELPKGIPVDVRRKLWVEYQKGRLPPPSQQNQQSSLDDERRCALTKNELDETPRIPQDPSDCEEIVTLTRMSFEAWMPWGLQVDNTTMQIIGLAKGSLALQNAQLHGYIGWTLKRVDGVSVASIDGIGALIGERTQITLHLSAIPPGAGGHSFSEL